MKKLSIIAAAILSTSTALAGDFTLSGEAGLTSNYIWRGISQSNEKMATQAGLEGSVDGIFDPKGSVFGGVWGSSVDFNDGGQATMELDIYGGYRYNLSDSTQLEVGAIYYAYPGANDSLNYDFWEVNAGATHTYSNGATTGAKISYAPSYTGDTGRAVYYELNGSYPLAKKVYVDAHIGRSDLDQQYFPDDYTDYGVGLNYNISENIGVRAGYSSTDLNGISIAKDQWSLSAKITF